MLLLQLCCCYSCVVVTVARVVVTIVHFVVTVVQIVAVVVVGGGVTVVTVVRVVRVVRVVIRVDVVLLYVQLCVLLLQGGEGPSEPAGVPSRVATSLHAERRPSKLVPPGSECKRRLQSC